MSYRSKRAELSTCVHYRTAICLSLLLSLAITAAAQDSAPQPRPYEDGPLTIQDYKANPPDGGTSLDAVTTSDVKYDFTYQVHMAGRRATAFVKEVTVLAIVKPGESWNRRPEDTRLMDHEQGHFDITYAWALKARIHFANQLKGRNSLTSVAGTAEAAIAGLNRLMQREMQPYIDGATAGHLQYDELTTHGTRPSPQAEQRKLQRTSLEELTKELKRIE